jgi:membrane protein
MSIRSAFSLLKQTYNKWSERQGPRLGASVAFYTLLSFAPLLVLTAAVVALVFTQEQAQDGLIDEARQMIGDRGADTVKSLLANAQKPSSGVFASVIAFVTLLFGASGVFTELRDALNMIWDVKPENESGWLGMVKQRLFSFGMVLSVGFLLLVSLIISAALAFIGTFLGHVMPIPAFALEIVNFLISFGVITFLFALMFKFVPAAYISWQDVRVGAIGTALLFTVGKMLLGVYLGKAGVGSAYGAAGSLVAMVVWVFYSAQIFFFGAEFTRVYADTQVKDSRRGVEQEKIGSELRAVGPHEDESRYEPMYRGEPAHPKLGPSLLIAAAVAFFLGRRSAKSKTSGNSKSL